VIQVEPIQARDNFFHAMSRPLGLEKGQPFRPDARQIKILTDAALVGEAMAKANTADRRFKDGKYRSDAHWDYALQLDADDPADHATSFCSICLAEFNSSINRLCSAAAKYFTSSDSRCSSRFRRHSLRCPIAIATINMKQTTISMIVGQSAF
jgi:hypothetical protein